jgi:predicted ATPase
VSLLETIREFALERLAETGEEDSTRRRHAEHYAWPSNPESSWTALRS